MLDQINSIKDLNIYFSNALGLNKHIFKYKKQTGTEYVNNYRTCVQCGGLFSMYNHTKNDCYVSFDIYTLTDIVLDIIETRGGFLDFIEYLNSTNTEWGELDNEQFSIKLLQTYASYMKEHGIQVLK